MGDLFKPRKPIELIGRGRVVNWIYWSKCDELLWLGLVDKSCCVARVKAMAIHGLGWNYFYFCWTGLRFVMVEVEDDLADNNVRLCVQEPKGMDFRNVDIFDYGRWADLCKTLMLDVL